VAGKFRTDAYVEVPSIQKMVPYAVFSFPVRMKFDMWWKYCVDGYV